MAARFVTFHYVMKDSKGVSLKSSYDSEPMMFLEGRSQIMAVLENEMKSLRKGDKKSILVKTADAYGDRDEKLVINVPLTQLPEGKAKIGQRFSLKTKELGTVIFHVVGQKADRAVLDGNHPLAGKDLVFDVEIMEARPANTTELLAFDEKEEDLPSPGTASSN